MLATYAAIRLACFTMKVLAAALGIIVACGLIIAGMGGWDIALGIILLLVATWDSEHASNTAYAIIRQHRAVRATRPPRYREGRAAMHNLNLNPAYVPNRIQDIELLERALAFLNGTGDGSWQERGAIADAIQARLARG